MDNFDKMQIHADISKQIWSSALTMLLVIAIVVSTVKARTVFYVFQFVAFQLFLISTIQSGRGLDAYARSEAMEAGNYYSKQTEMCYYALFIFSISFGFLLF